jgi:hypothetical protein
MLEIHVVLPPFLLTPCSRVLLRKLVVSQLVMKSPPNVLAEWIALQLCMRHVQDSDLGLEAVSPEGSLVLFSHRR